MIKLAFYALAIVAMLAMGASILRAGADAAHAYQDRTSAAIDAATR
jgi:hypothetical protein